MIPNLVDSHCHLDLPEFEGDIENIIARAAAVGVNRLVTICTRLKNEPTVRSIAENHAPIFYAAGTHPMSALEEPLVSLEELIVLTQHPKMIGIGETGLDYHYTSESAQIQKDSLRVHIAAAQETGLPLIIHARAADEDMAHILSDEHRNGAFSCVMHCYCSGPELAKIALNLGFYLSMSGIVTFKNSHEVRDIFAATPLDRILVETDAPYLAPTPFRGKRNEPAFTTNTAQVGADLFKMKLVDFAAQTTGNFHRLFTKATKHQAAT